MGAPPQQSDQLTEIYSRRFDAHLLLRLRGILFCFLLAYAASFTLPLVFNSTSTGLDPSWSFASNYFPGSDYKYGPDVIFTHGPLGFVCWPESVGWKLPAALALRVLVWAFLITELAIAYRRLRAAPLLSFLSVLSLIVAHPVLNYLFDYLLASAALLLVVRERPEEQRFWRGTLPLSMLISLAFLAKASVYMMLMPAFLLYFATAYWQEWSRPSRAALLRFVWVVIAPFIAYLVYNPSVGGLWAYVTASASIVSGFSRAMSTSGLPSGYLRLASFVTLLVSFAVCAIWRKWLKSEVVACVMISLFVAIKHSVIRADHEVFIYGFGMVLFAILVVSCRPVRAAAVAGGATWVLLCILALSGMNSRWMTLSLQRWNPASHLEQIDKLFHWTKSIASMAAQTDANLRADALPDSLLVRIHGGPVVIFPWELAYGPANHLNLVPLYTLQAYQAYTNRLDRATADHLMKTPRDTRLLIEWKSIDGRHPLLDVPATWEAICNGFEGELATPDVLLLKKKDHWAAFNFKTIKRAISHAHDWQDVPDRGHAVGASVTFSPTLIGIARGLLYKVDPVYMDLETDRGELMRFRVIPGVLRHPFVINCLPLNGADLQSLIFGNVCEEKVKRFRFSGEGLNSFSSSTEVAFDEAPEARLQFAADRLLKPESGASDVRFGGRFLLRAARFVPNRGGLRMELDWQSLSEQPLKYFVFVHLIDQSGRIVAQADHEQAPRAGEAAFVAKAGENWRDVIQLSRSQLKGVTRIALGIWEPPATFLTADRGDRDWDNRRLILLLARQINSETSSQ